MSMDVDQQSARRGAMPKRLAGGIEVDTSEPGRRLITGPSVSLSSNEELKILKVLGLDQEDRVVRQAVEAKNNGGEDWLHGLWQKVVPATVRKTFSEFFLCQSKEHAKTSKGYQTAVTLGGAIATSTALGIAFLNLPVTVVGIVVMGVALPLAVAAGWKGMGWAVAQVHGRSDHLMKNSVADSFNQHHVDPRDIRERSFSDHSWPVSVVAAPLQMVAATLATVYGFPPWVTAGILVALNKPAFDMQSHKWAHMHNNAPTLAKILQGIIPIAGYRLRLALTLRDHAKHHREAHNSNFGLGNDAHGGDAQMNASLKRYWQLGVHMLPGLKVRDVRATHDVRAIATEWFEKNPPKRNWDGVVPGISGMFHTDIAPARIDVEATNKIREIVAKSLKPVRNADGVKTGDNAPWTEKDLKKIYCAKNPTFTERWRTTALRIFFKVLQRDAGRGSEFIDPEGANLFMLKQSPPEYDRAQTQRVRTRLAGTKFGKNLDRIYWLSSRTVSEA